MFLPLDQKVLLESISKHLDSLADLIKWAIVFAVALWWAGWQRQDPIDILGVKLARQHAFVLGVIAYSAVNAAVLLKLLRIADLMLALRPESLGEGVTRLTAHSWELNPFAYFGSNFFARAHSCVGFGGLIVVWWLCNSSLYTLGLSTGKFGLFLLGIFLVIGLWSLVMIQRIFSIVLARTKDHLQEVHELLAPTERERTMFAMLGIGVGGVLAFVTNVLVVS
jgi:hypothetical protein